jgi:phospholipase D1/2
MSCYPDSTHEQTSIWDVFLLDSDFHIERPTRYYRQGLNLLHPDAEDVVDDLKDKARLGVPGVAIDSDRRSFVGTIKSGISKVLHPRHKHHHRHRHHGRGRSGSTATANGTTGSRVRRDPSCESSSSSDSSSSEEEEQIDGHRTSQAPMLDPSTNVNPLQDEGHENHMLNEVLRGESFGDGSNAKKSKGKGRSGDVSRHTFYIENSQTRLKLYARNEASLLLAV